MSKCIPPALTSACELDSQTLISLLDTKSQEIFKLHLSEAKPTSTLFLSPHVFPSYIEIGNTTFHSEPLLPACQACCSPLRLKSASSDCPSVPARTWVQVSSFLPGHTTSLRIPAGPPSSSLSQALSPLLPVPGDWLGKPQATWCSPHLHWTYEHPSRSCLGCISTLPHFHLLTLHPNNTGFPCEVTL